MGARGGGCEESQAQSGGSLAALEHRDRDPPGLGTEKVAELGVEDTRRASPSKDSVPDPEKVSTYVPGATCAPSCPTEPHACAATKQRMPRQQ